MKKRLTKGYSLVEVLVAVSILMLSIVGPITIAAKSLQSAQFVRQQDTAFFLAQEGISLVRLVRDDEELVEYFSQNGNDPWANFQSVLSQCYTANGCGIDALQIGLSQLQTSVKNCSPVGICDLKFNGSSPRAVYQYSSGTQTPYTRTITLTKNGAGEVIVKSTVSWQSTLLGGAQSVTLQTSLFDLYKYDN